MSQNMLEENTFDVIEAAERLLEGEQPTDPSAPSSCMDQRIAAVMGNGFYTYC
ncbi:hypothetical protein ACFWJ4_11095 [Kitasatospora sp. NPDC127067]|uniref:hypothetical protein n=1 Tax=Kitasatospora sp. NPDC127067 TaxID=3347126 RepID=UPI003657BF39